MLLQKKTVVLKTNTRAFADLKKHNMFDNRSIYLARKEDRIKEQ